MTTVENRVENPLNNSAIVESVGVPDAGMVEVAVEVAMQREEEAMMGGDEEINSCEAEDIEDKMLTVALVKSVVDSGNIKTSDNDSECVRHPVRKRRRPSGDVEAGHNATQPTPCKTTALHELENPVPDPMRNMLAAGHDTQLQQGEETIRVTGKAQFPSDSTINEPPGTATIQGSMSSGLERGEPKGQTVAHQKRPSRTDVPVATSVSRPIAPQSTTTKKPPSAPATKRGSAVKKKSSRKTPAKSQKGKKVTLKVPANATKIKKDEGFPSETSRAVPNPLLASTAAPQILPKAKKEVKQEAVLQHSQETVPCPLPAPSVPCPLAPGETNAEQPENIVSYVASAAIPKRGRVFSVDLDPSTFDFTDVVSEYAAEGDKTDSAHVPDASISSHTTPSDLAIFQRDRAFSFEVFNFSGDDLLPPPPAPAVHSAHLAGSPIPIAAAPSPVAPPPLSVPEPEIGPTVAATRPRGDSIIFDPVSFQDGGIHEKNALLKVKTTNPDGPPEGLLADSSLAAPPNADPQPSASHSNYRTNPVVTQSFVHMDTATTQSSGHPLPAPAAVPSSSEIATLPSALSSETANAASSPATFQMELLNKDGRIGIYLPEERRQRIARFHAKRKMRIWRKRIKYDCRKKLADSRPRIKGRFVKRSDTEEA